MNRLRLLLRLLVLPGQFLHELAHAAAGERWAAETEVQWHPEPQVTFRWEEPAAWQKVLTHLAPTLIGLPLGVLIVASIAAGMGGGLPLIVWIWVFASWLYFSTPTPADLGALVVARGSKF